VAIDGESALEVPPPPPTINVSGNSVGRSTDVPDMDIVELSQVLVYTASRRLTSVELAPSVVTVITADDIARRGYKSLYEALGDVPGFQELGVAAWGLLSNRGLVADNNVSYLFLVDGHSMANIVFRGYYEEYRFPLLAKVERIEIVRGPGATLWGSDASMGVINIVTKNGSSVDDGSSGAGKILADYDHEFTLKRDIVNLAYGKRFGHERDLYMTFNVSNSNAPWTDGRIAGPNGLQQPAWLWFRMNQWDYDPSFDFFVKYRWDGLEIEAGVNQSGYMQPFYTPFDGTKAGSFTSRRNWIDVRRPFRISDTLQLDARIYLDDYSNRGKQWQLADNSVVLTNETKATIVGVEPVLHYEGEAANALLGLSASHGRWTVNDYNSFSGTDLNYAVFAEGSYPVLRRLRLTAGVRFEGNRGRGTNTLPRFSAIFGPWNNWALKYSYNTGFVRFGTNFSPTPEFVNGFWRVNGSEPQRSRSHDLQLNYKSNRTAAAVTVFSQRLTSLPAYIGDKGPVIGQIDGVNVYHGIVGLSPLQSYGVEVEGEHRFGDFLKLYANAAYQHARWSQRYPFGESGNFDIVRDTSLSTDGLVPTTVPAYTWNLGVNFDITRKLLFNVHYRGNARTYVKTNTSPPGFQTVHAKHFLDATINYSPRQGLVLSVYGKNILDNEDPIPHINSGFIDQPLRRQIGLKATVEFALKRFGTCSPPGRALRARRSFPLRWTVVGSAASCHQRFVRRRSL